MLRPADEAARFAELEQEEYLELLDKSIKYSRAVMGGNLLSLID